MDIYKNMNYLIPQDKLDKVVFKYMDMTYGDLEKIEGSHRFIIFIQPEERFGIMAWRDKNLYLWHIVVESISDMFHISNDDAKDSIIRWFMDRFNLDVESSWISLNVDFIKKKK